MGWLWMDSSVTMVIQIKSMVAAIAPYHLVSIAMGIPAFVNNAFLIAWPAHLIHHAKTVHPSLIGTTQNVI